MEAPKVTAAETVCGRINKKVQHAIVLADGHPELNRIMLSSVLRCIEAAELYEKAAQLARGAKARSLLRQMGRRKRRQAREVSTFRNGEAERGPQHTAPMSNYLDDVHLDKAGTLQDAFVMALKREHQTLELFARGIQDQQDEGIRAFLLYQIKQQRDTIRELEREFARRSRPYLQTRSGKRPHG